jgi:ketosteroid isomerase-like protein
MRYTVVWVAVALFMAACAPPAAVSNDPETSKQVVQRLDLLNQLLAAKDKGIVNEFETDALLLGSEENEIAIGRDQLDPFFAKLFALPVKVSWAWKETRVTSLGDIAWLYADGEVVETAKDGKEVRAPYRLTGVLGRTGGSWKWRLFHGSEPARGQ